MPGACPRFCFTRDRAEKHGDETGPRPKPPNRQPHSTVVRYRPGVPGPRGRAATHEVIKGAVCRAGRARRFLHVVRNTTWNMRYACQSERSRELGRLLRGVCFKASARSPRRSGSTNYPRIMWSGVGDVLPNTASTSLYFGPKPSQEPQDVALGALAQANPIHEELSLGLFQAKEAKGCARGA